jgi:hypothetical protein
VTPLEKPVQVQHCPVSGKVAFVFVHGFGGDTSSTWSALLHKPLTFPAKQGREVSQKPIQLGNPG